MRGWRKYEEVYFLDKAQVFKQVWRGCSNQGSRSDPSVTTVMDGARKMLELVLTGLLQLVEALQLTLQRAMWIKYESTQNVHLRTCARRLRLRTSKESTLLRSILIGNCHRDYCFSVITDYDKGIKYPLADFQITPDVAIVDPDLTELMPQKLVAHTGMDALTHAIEAFVSLASDYTDAPALYAIQMIQKNLSFVI